MRKIMFLILISISANLYSQNKINKIEFYTDGYASEPDFDMVIYADRTALFIARSDNYKGKVNGDVVAYGVNKEGVNIRETEIKGIFKTKLKRKSFKEVKKMINCLEEEFIKKTYSSNYFHSSEGKLIVSFKNGETASIHDIGLSGTNKLIKLYDFFKKLRFEEKWE